MPRQIKIIVVSALAFLALTTALFALPGQALADTCYEFPEDTNPDANCVPDGNERCLEADDDGNCTQYGGNVYVDTTADYSESQRIQIKEDVAAQKQKSVTGEPSSSNPCGWLSFGCQIAWLINSFLDMLMGAIFYIVEAVFNMAIELNSKSFGEASNKDILTIATTGWLITRDVSNMFFVFILLFVAVATIFGFEQYNIKNILPKLIVMALLINFSLPISTLVINTSNALAKVFSVQMAKYGGPRVIIASLGLDSLPLAKAVEANKFSLPSNRDKKQLAADLSRNIKATLSDGSEVTQEFCKNLSSSALAGASPRSREYELRSLCPKLDAEFAVALKNISNDTFGQDYTLTVLKSIGVKLIVYPVSIFILLAGSIMLFARVISLSFLIILAPLVFLLNILPATQRYWGQWWDSLLKWSFFFPAFMFFFMLSLFAMKISMINTSNQQGGLLVADMFFNLFLGVGLMIGSLYISQQLGVTFAGTAMGMGKRWVGSIKKAAGRAVYRGGARVAGTAGEAAIGTKVGQFLGRVPVLRQLTRLPEAAIRAKSDVDSQRAAQLRKSIENAPAGYAEARLRGERARVQAEFLRSANQQEMRRVEDGAVARGDAGRQELAQIIRQALVFQKPGEDLTKTIENKLRDLDLLVATSRNMEISNPQFTQAREQYVKDASDATLHRIVKPENIRTVQELESFLNQRGPALRNIQTEMIFKAMNSQELKRFENDANTNGTIDQLSRITADASKISSEIKKELESGLKNIDLKVSAASGVNRTSADFGLAKENYLRELTPSQLRDLATPENIRNDQALQNFIVQNVSENEINAMMQNSQQLIALRGVFERWTNEAFTDQTSNAGKNMRDMIDGLVQGLGLTRPEAEAEARRGMREGEYLGRVLEERGASQDVQKWANNVPAMRVIMGEGRIFGRKGVDYEELMRNWQTQSGGGNTGGNQPSSGGTASGGTTP